jgi:hypothetical protein
MSFISLGVLGSRSEPGSSGGVLAVFKYTVGDVIASASFGRTTSASYIDDSGTVNYVAPNIPRDQHYIFGQQYLLLEPTRTNQLGYSPYINNWPIQGAVVASPTKTLVTHTAPDGVVTTTYSRANFPAVTGAGAYSSFYGQYVYGSNLVLSMWVQGNAGLEVTYLFARRNDGTYASSKLKLSTFWKNYSVAVGSSPTNTNCQIGTDLRDGAQTSTSALSLFAWGRQIEDGGYQTSLITTPGLSAVTRAADSMSFAVPGGAGQVGTLYEKYWDLATLTNKETVNQSYVTSASFSPTVGRAWISWKFALGTQTLGTMQGV